MQLLPDSSPTCWIQSYDRIASLETFPLTPNGKATLRMLLDHTLSFFADIFRSRTCGEIRRDVESGIAPRKIDKARLLAESCSEALGKGVDKG